MLMICHRLEDIELCDEVYLTSNILSGANSLTILLLLSAISDFGDGEGTSPGKRNPRNSS